MSNYRDLQVWNLAHELVLTIYKYIERFPNEEKFALTDQIRRAVSSIPLNICEGTGRKSKKDFCHFLYISRGSLHETEYLMLLSRDLGYITEEDYTNLDTKCKSIGKLLNALINSLSEEN